MNVILTTTCKLTCLVYLYLQLGNRQTRYTINTKILVLASLQRKRAQLPQWVPTGDYDDEDDDDEEDDDEDDDDDDEWARWIDRQVTGSVPQSASCCPGPWVKSQLMPGVA